MKNRLLIITFLSAIAFTSCKNETNKAEAEDTHLEETDSLENEIDSPENVCYSYISEKDTILLKMNKINDNVAGTLNYNYFEKDKNEGTFEGTMVGDTLRADYTFNSEGTQSVREILFVQKGINLIEGFGDVEEVNGKMKFKKGAKFSLNKNLPLKQVDCDEN